MRLPTVVEWGGFEQTLLQAARAETAPREALRKSAAALGLPVIGLAAVEMSFAGSAAQAMGATGALATTEAATAALASSTPAGATALATSSAAAGAAGMASQPIATASLAFLAKHVGAGVLAGALFAGGAHEASKAFDAPTSRRADAPGHVQRPDARSASAHRNLPVRHAASPPTEPGSSAAALSSSEPAARATAARAPSVPAGVTVPAAREGADDAITLRTDTNTPAANVAAFPTEPSPQADPNTRLEAMPEPVGLDLERRLLGRARRALAHGRPLVALRHLGLYSAKCPGGQLLAEANLLRVEALLRTGQRDKALWVGRQEIKRNSTRATVERVREMFEAQGEPADGPDAGVSRQVGEKE
ncbi:MAG: hypothetical protein JW940_37880 [Polyangiaceae bacterium]|nr:hypothetical protein [Polyangiaceae bacterium]